LGSYPGREKSIANLLFKIKLNNIVFLIGDFACPSWALDVAMDHRTSIKILPKRAFAVEFGVTSISPNEYSFR
jgi:hypothetical protein